MNEQSDFYYDQLFAAAFSMPEVRESRSGGWTYTFTCPPLEFTNITFTPVVAPSTPINWIRMDMGPNEETLYTISYRGHIPEHVRVRDPRAIRLRKIKRRQKRAAYRRKKRGLA
jgi:hypothetical protein